MRDSPAQRFRINLRWLLKLRWLAVGGQLATVAFTHAVLGLAMPFARLLPFIALGAITNAALEIASRRMMPGGPAPGERIERAERGGESLVDAKLSSGDWVLASIMVLDILLLSALLYVSGGTSNPFSLFYLVNIALAATLLQPVFAWALVGLAVACFVSLFFFHQPLPGLRDAIPMPGRAAGADYASAGMLVAIAGAATILVYFVTRVKAELARREAELALQRQRQARTEKFEALATLAAGAAHELATPLSTIAVISRELELALDREATLDHAAEDARLMRREVDRCRAILDQMSFDAGDSVGEAMTAQDVEGLCNACIRPLHAGDRVVLEIDEPARRATVDVPRRAVSRALRGIVKNAIDASPSDRPVRVRARLDGEFVQLSVEDRGAGMDPATLDRASEPFYTTKEPGVGMGLGLFLARSIVDRIGGSFEIRSEPGKGTIVHVRIPRVARREDALLGVDRPAERS